MEITQNLDAIDTESFLLQWSADVFGPPADIGITRNCMDTLEGVTPKYLGLRESHAR